MSRCTLTLILILVAMTIAACADQASSSAPAALAAAVTPSPSVVTVRSPAATTSATPSTIPADATREPVVSVMISTPTAVSRPAATPSATTSPSPTFAAVTTVSPPTATATPEGPVVVVQVNANLRAGPGTAYPIIGAARQGDRLPVAGQAQGWWQARQGDRVAWIFGTLVTANATAGWAPEVTDFPPPTVAVKVEAPAEPGATPTSTPTLTSASPLADLVVLGLETRYPVQARVIRGWGYEFVDLSAAYDIVVYRDVFGMLAHQIDDENVQRYRRKSRYAQYGPIRITLVDAQPHPDPGCPGWGWVPNRDTFVDPYGMTQNPCRVEHSLFPQGDGASTTLLIGWGYTAGTTAAVGAAGPHLADYGTTFLAETLPWPAHIGPADRPDFSQSLYRPLGVAHWEDGRWVWTDAFAEIAPAPHR